MAERFGTFKDFLKRHDEKIDRRRRPEIEAVMKAHYEKYGSSDEESDNTFQPAKDKSINISLI